MHADAIVSRVLEPCLAELHAKRAAALHRAVVSVVCGAALSLSCIALEMSGKCKLRHRVKSADRLLGNERLHQERLAIYAHMARWLAGLPQLLIVVDWSNVTPDQRWHMLRAGVVVNGRSVTLYEEVHPQSNYGKPKVHKRFVARLAQILPAGSVPIVMTDAGFKSGWFELIEERGWNYVGRVRGGTLLSIAGQAWMSVKRLYEQATAKALDLGHCACVQSNPTACRLVLVKEDPKGRHRLNMYGERRRSRTSIRCAATASEPWLLAASRGLDHLSAQAVVRLFAQRMTVEQSFRDTKSLRWGQGLEVSRSRHGERLEMLLLIADLAAFVQRLVGEEAKAQQLELQFCPTNRRSRPQISVMTLGRRILDSPGDWLDQLDPSRQLHPLREQARAACA